MISLLDMLILYSKLCQIMSMDGMPHHSLHRPLLVESMSQVDFTTDAPGQPAQKWSFSAAFLLLFCLGDTQWLWSICPLMMVGLLGATSGWSVG